MPLNSFNIGSDCRVVVQHPLAAGGQLDLGDVANFKAMQQTKALSYTRLDGQTKKGEYPTGWSGSFQLERTDHEVDDFICTLEQAILNNQNPGPGAIYQYVTELDGSTSTYQYAGVAFKLADAGTYAGAETVKQTLNFEASTRMRV